MGGVTINTDTAVTDTHHQPIVGAYAAGEVVGGIHGGNRIGGNAVADIIIFGTGGPPCGKTRQRLTLSDNRPGSPGRFPAASACPGDTEELQ